MLPKIIDLFSGCGGLALGFEKAGFDIVAGIESGMDPVLVLSGVSTKETIEKFPYRPRLVLNGVGDIPE